MNINDIKDPIVVPDLRQDKAANILNMQSQLEDHYWVIEKRTNKVIKVNSREGQIEIKDILWRITEELGEALEVQDPCCHDSEKVKEEIADALHFMTALFIVTNRNKLFIDNLFTLDSSFPFYDDPAVDLFVSLGLIGNTLKLKPWKQTGILTDENKFDKALIHMLACFTKFLEHWKISHYVMYETYMKKAQVNLFRIRSNY